MDIGRISQLRGLAAIGKRHGVAFTLRGGAAFRCMLRLRQLPTLDTVDLFDLVPAASDINLVHSGTAQLNAVLLDQILAEAPGAECFRWELLSRDQLSVAAGGADYGNLVPARMVEIGDSSTGVVDPAQGLADIGRRCYRYFRDPRFLASARYRSGRDLEVLSALLYLQTLAEAGLDIDEQVRQPGWRAIEEVFTQTGADALPMLEEYPCLRERLRRRLIAAMMAYPERWMFHKAASVSGLEIFLEQAIAPRGPVRLEDALREQLLWGRQDLATIVDADRLLGDRYRIEATREPWTAPGDARHVLPELAHGQRVLLVSPPLSIRSGRPSTGAGSAGQAEPRAAQQEFVILSLPAMALETPALLAGLGEAEDADLTVFLMVSEHDRWVPLALPAIVNTRRDGDGRVLSLDIRMNCLGLLHLAAEPGAATAHVALVAWRPEG